MGIMGFDQNNDVSYSKWERIFFGIGAGIVFTGIILKYNHIHVSRYFLIIGIAIALLSFLVGLFLKDKDQVEEED